MRECLRHLRNLGSRYTRQLTANGSNDASHEGRTEKDAADAPRSEAVEQFRIRGPAREGAKSIGKGAKDAVRSKPNNSKEGLVHRRCYMRGRFCNPVRTSRFL